MLCKLFLLVQILIKPSIFLLPLINIIIKKEENVNGLKVFVKPGYVAKDVAKKVETHLNEVGSKHTSGNILLLT